MTSITALICLTFLANDQEIRPSVKLTCVANSQGDLSLNESRKVETEIFFTESQIQYTISGPFLSTKIRFDKSGGESTMSDSGKFVQSTLLPGKAYETTSFKEVMDFFKSLKLPKGKVVAKDWSRFFKTTTKEISVAVDGKKLVFISERAQVPVFLQLPPILDRGYLLDDKGDQVKMVSMSALTEVSIEIKE